MLQLPGVDTLRLTDIAAVTTDELDDNDDHLIVRGCTAGFVLANRRSEDSRVTVSVLEAGIHRPR